MGRIDITFLLQNELSPSSIILAQSYRALEFEENLEVILSNCTGPTGIQKEPNS